VTATPSGTASILDIATISRADHWIDDVLPRFARLIDENSVTRVRKHLLLLVDDDDQQYAEAERTRVASRLGSLFDRVAVRYAPVSGSGPRLLAYDALRAGLVSELGLRELLYLDPDTDVVEDLGGLPLIAPHADLLWVANPLVLGPVLEDLIRHRFEPGDPNSVTLLEPGFLYLRGDLRSEFESLVQRHPNVNAFAAGSTYWNMLARSLGSRAVRLPDVFNRTFWDVAAAIRSAKTVHYTGRWKQLQPFVSYDRLEERIIISADVTKQALAIRPGHLAPVSEVGPKLPDIPRALSVVMMVRDGASHLPHVLRRFEAWEQRGVAMRYTFLENDSVDGTAALIRRFMACRNGDAEYRSLAIPYNRSSHGQDRRRIVPLARMRNHVLQLSLRSSVAVDEEWTLLLDAGIHFDEDVLGDVFTAMAADPDPSSIAMATCYTRQAVRVGSPGACNPIADLPGMAATEHYFDTYAFHDAGYESHYPYCPFERCTICPAAASSGVPRRRIPRERAIVDVAAAFAGLALIPTPLLHCPRVRWDTYGTGIGGSSMLAEHVLFCDRLRTVSGGRVVVLQNVERVYRL